MRDFAKDHSALALNTATLGHNVESQGAGWSPERVIDACAERGFGGRIVEIHRLPHSPRIIQDSHVNVNSVRERCMITRHSPAPAREAASPR